MMQKDDYLKIKVTSIKGRYVTNEHINLYLKTLGNPFRVDELGRSVNNQPIYGVRVGHGPKRIFMWSQMHGNESTTTKAVLDLLSFLKQGTPQALDLLRNVSLNIIPILNPDGARAYTRFNANNVDLNRDAKNITQPESKVLRETFEKFEPNFCFNLHDQRTIFNVAKLKSPATVSFLAPAFDEERNNSISRSMAMKIVASMNSELQRYIPAQVGRFDDSFNPNCVGDAFQMEKVPTILFEAGHYPEDYERETTREMIFYALYKAIQTIAFDEIENYATEDYFEIPENNKLFFDVVLQNAHVLDPSLQVNSCASILYKEVLKNGRIVFIPTVAEKGFELGEYFGHKTMDCLDGEDLKWLRSKKITELIKQQD